MNTGHGHGSSQTAGHCIQHLISSSPHALDQQPSFHLQFTDEEVTSLAQGHRAGEVSSSRTPSPPGGCRRGQMAPGSPPSMAQAKVAYTSCPHPLQVTQGCQGDRCLFSHPPEGPALKGPEALSSSLISLVDPNQEASRCCPINGCPTSGNCANILPCPALPQPSLALFTNRQGACRRAAGSQVVGTNSDFTSFQSFPVFL